MQKDPGLRQQKIVETIFSSSKYATLGSSKEIALLKAAIESNAKKAGPTILPKGMSTKADNRLTNTRPGLHLALNHMQK